MTETTTESSKEKVCLIDGSGYIFRAFFASPMMTNPEGLPVNAVYGFLNMFLSLTANIKCDYCLVLFDAKRQNFRNEFFPEYKATRPELPPELKPQFALIHEVVEALNLHWLQMEGYEADDLIATYTDLALRENKEVTIVSADKDLMQLIRPGVKFYDGMKNKFFGQTRPIRFQPCIGFDHMQQQRAVIFLRHLNMKIKYFLLNFPIIIVQTVKTAFANQSLRMLRNHLFKFFLPIIRQVIDIPRMNGKSRCNFFGVFCRHVCRCRPIFRFGRNTDETDNADFFSRLQKCLQALRFNFRQMNVRVAKIHFIVLLPEY